MSFAVYKALHITGALLLTGALVSISVHYLSGGDRQSLNRKAASIMHGIGLLLLLVAGFGMLARLNIHWPWPGWIMVKMGLWVFAGAMIALVMRLQQKALLTLLLSYGTVIAAVIVVFTTR